MESSRQQTVRAATRQHRTGIRATKSNQSTTSRRSYLLHLPDSGQGAAPLVLYRGHRLGQPTVE